MNRLLVSCLVTGILVVAGCTAETVDDDFSIDTGELQVTKTGSHLEATFTGGDMQIAASADETAPDQYLVTIWVGTDHVSVAIDDVQGAADVTGDLYMDQDAADSLQAFTRALYQALPRLTGVADRVYRTANLHANHPVDMPVEARVIHSEQDLRGWSSLCSQYYAGENYTASFDEECNCSWGFCDQCRHTDTHVVGGDTHHGFCFAACGEGCGSGTDYTRDCGNHDACVDGGYNSYECLDEFGAASDDYLFAPNC